jgi:hypothetical protein
MQVQADLSGVADYIGTVGGILEAVEDPRFKGDFVEHMMNGVENTFMTDTIAAAEAGNARIAHVFEWGSKQGEISNIPLFKLTREGGKGERRLGYMFLPSTKYVPLPDASKYGIKPGRVEMLRRHVFQLKALVMETQSNVRITPMGASKLFIPTKKAKAGYVMTAKAVNVNPGGAIATGGFADWWNTWFATKAQGIVTEESQSTERWLVATGAKYVRYAAGTRINGVAVGGRFAAGKNVTAGYVNAKAEEVKRKVLGEAKAMFNEDKWLSTWDE